MTELCMIETEGVYIIKRIVLFLSHDGSLELALQSCAFKEQITSDSSRVATSHLVKFLFAVVLQQLID